MAGVAGLVAAALLVGACSSNRSESAREPGATTSSEPVGPSAEPGTTADATAGTVESPPDATTTTTGQASEEPARADVLRRTGTAADPLRVALLGDSVGLTMFESLELALDSDELAPAGPSEVLVGGFLGLGFTTDSPGLYDGEPIAAVFDDWRESWQPFVNDNDPDVVVMMQGVWDAIPRQVDGEWLEPGTEPWRDWYAARVEEFASALADRAVRLTWVLQPCNDGPHPVEPVNDVIREEARRAGFGVVDLSATLCENGLPRELVTSPTGVQVRVWHEDGIHFETYEAPTVLGPLLAAALADDWGF